MLRDVITGRRNARRDDKKTAVRQHVVRTSQLLKRSRDSKADKTKRKKSQQWAQTLDRALRCATSLNGLDVFHYPAERRLAESAYSWKLLRTLADQGSDGVCTTSWCKRIGEINIDACWGAAHRSWRDLQQGLRSSLLWALQVVFMMVWNSDSGSWADDERYWGLRTCCNDNFEFLTADQDMVFQALSSDYIDDHPELRSLLSLPDADAQIYSHLQGAPLFSRKPDHVSSNRFSVHGDAVGRS